MQQDSPTVSSSKGGRKRGVRFAEASGPVDVRFSFQVLKYLLRHPADRATLLRKHPDHVKELLRSLRGYLKLAEALAVADQATADEGDSDVIATAWEIMLKASVLLLTVNKRDATAVSLTEWAALNLGFTSNLAVRMANYFFNCACGLFSSGLLHSNDNQTLADAVLIMSKKLSISADGGQ